MNESPDRDLILRARRGETDAFGELVQRYQATVFNVCYRLMSERREAEDMAQEAFIRAYARLGTFDLERPFAPWMRRVAANVCLNRLSSPPAVQVELEVDEERDPDDALQRPEPLYEQGERAALLRAALASLPAHYRMVIELRHYQELSYEEIARTLQIPLSDVKSHLFRARKLLAEKLKHDLPL
jgi:RNA polymerase sigma-70 factor (ECF subfamily)